MKLQVVVKVLQGRCYRISGIYLGAARGLLCYSRWLLGCCIVVGMVLLVVMVLWYYRWFLRYCYEADIDFHMGTWMKGVCGRLLVKALY